MTAMTGHMWRGRRMPSALDVLMPGGIADSPDTGNTLLIGWELGGGHGHVLRLVPVVRGYLERGWRVVAALRDVPTGNIWLDGLRAMVGPQRLQVIQAPRFADRRAGDEPPVSLAEILCRTGFDDAATVRPLVHHWQAIVRVFRPDAVLSDFAPALNLAVRGRLPLSVIGNGWTLPPDRDGPVPFAVPAEATPTIDHQARILCCARAVAGPDHAPQRFCDLLRGDINALCVIPELDPYHDHRTDAWLWSPEMPAPQPVPPTQRAGGLVYLPPHHPARASVTQACANSNMPFRAYFGGAGAGQFGNLTVMDEPIDFIRKVPRSKVVIHHGGLGTAMWALVNDVAQWACPDDAEKRIYRDLLNRHNAAGGLSRTMQANLAMIPFQSPLTTHAE